MYLISLAKILRLRRITHSSSTCLLFFASARIYPIYSLPYRGISSFVSTLCLYNQKFSRSIVVIFEYVISTLSSSLTVLDSAIWSVITSLGNI